MVAPRVIAMMATIIPLSFLPSINAYDIGCIYPTAMPEPFEARYRLAEVSSVAISSLETPVVIHIAHASSYCNVNCLAVHDATALNSLTRERPILAAPPYGHNAFSIAMCIAECYNTLSGRGNAMEPLFEKWQLPVTGLEPQVLAAVIKATTDPTDLLNLLVSRDFDPLLFGQLVAIEIGTALSQDGWNNDGALTYDAELGEAIPCTANCQAYADTTGYSPRNYPSSKAGKKLWFWWKERNSKYKVQGSDQFWRPLLESKSGYFSRQEHVTPHIGVTAQTMFPFDASKHCPDPKYDYYEESLQ